MLSLSQARRIALAAQGFDRPRPGGRIDVRHIRRVLLQLGILQLDYVNVLVPAHYFVLFSRLGPYDRSRLDELLYRRREFTEHWAHEASVVPMSTWPLLRHRREDHRVRPWGFEKFLEEFSEYVERVLAEVKSRGPLSADDLPEPGAKARHMSDQWGWRLAQRRQVLEAHFGFGRLAAAYRKENFQRVYDLAERIIPPDFYSREVSRLESQRELLLQAARGHGVATAADLADYFRMSVKEARPRIAELVEDGKLMRVRVEGWKEVAYLHGQARQPRRIRARALISPFDPLIWFRPRVARLFGFEYRIEIFVPAPKRKWGYYVLPFLSGDRLVARVDLKADRKASRLLVQSAHLEPEADAGAVAASLASELCTLADWLGLASIKVRGRGALPVNLRNAVE